MEGFKGRAAQTPREPAVPGWQAPVPHATMRPMTTVLLCLSTCPDPETAARIARVLVEERLAACVNRIPGVASTYRWDDGIQDDAEVLLLIKTTRTRFAALRERLIALHPYDVPELVALEIAEGHQPYLAWLAAAVQGPTPGGGH